MKQVLSSTFELFCALSPWLAHSSRACWSACRVGCVQQLGPEHPATATSLNNLAELYRAQGRYGEAVALSVPTPARVVRQPKAR